MGCDIHMYAEIRDSQGNWRATKDKIFQNPWHDKTRAPKGYNQPFINHPDVGRNYNLFAILANVRNGRGFAGCKTGEVFEPIDMPRGLPDDVSAEIQAESNAWGIDGHSHSWLTAKEIIDFDYSKIHKSCGVVNLENFKVFIEQGKPDSWCGDVHGSVVVKISNDDMLAVMNAEATNGKDSPKYLRIAQAMIDKYSTAKGEEIRLSNLEAKDANFYTLVEWQETYEKAIGNNILKEKHIPALMIYEKNPDNIRFVFWFDN